ncbi:MAG: fibronectin type III domain-containing protein [Acidimicrobiales bacterium]|nr:fibronectin type III domain-containing protein [Acidimicrobiales bacterium]
MDEFTGLQGAGAGNRVSVDPEDPQVVLFEAGPAAPAADSFDYTVVDAHGARATARVTVLVLDDGGWAPLAHDDVYIGRPGRTISVPTLANDTSPQDRRLELAELPFFGADGQPTADAQHPDAVSVRDQRDPANRGRIDVVVPSDGTTLVEHYRISDGRSGSDAFVRVSPDPQAPNLPPVANTDVVALEESRGVDSVEVDVLRNDVDPDDAGAALTVTIPGGQNATVAGSTVVVPIETKARTVLYRVTDADGGAAVGRIRVPGDENHPPVLSELGRDRDQRRIPPGTSEPITLTVAALVTDPDGDPDLALTAREIAVLGGTGEVRRTESGDGFVFTPPAERQQQTIAAIQFEVTDRPALSEAERQQPGCNCTALLTVEAVIEASSPPRVLTQGSVRVPQLDEPVSFDLAPLATDDQGDPLSFAVDGAAAGGLDVQLDGTVLTVVSRRSGADKLPVSATVPIAFTVSDGTFDPVAGTVVATVIQTNRGQPSAGALPTQDAERDEPINLPNLVALASNPFPDRPLELVNATVDNGATVTCTPDGTCTFRSSTVGTFTVGYTLRDAVEQTARGTVTVVVKGKPRAPGVPSVRSVGDKRVTLAWTAADLQGGSLVAYHVTAVEAGATKTFTGTGGEFDGLQNGRTYHFTVRAENELGMGDESAPSSEAVPDRVPDPPVALRITDYQDQQLTLQWSPPASAGDYTAIRAYRIQIGGQSLTVNDGSQTSLVVGRGGVGSPLQNGTAHTFRIQAQNAAATNGGWGAYSADSAAETPSRYPDPPTGVAATNSGDGGSPRLTVTWAAPVSNGGRAVNQYRVCQVQTPANCATSDGATRQATFDLPRNQQASFTVIAFNTDKNRNNSEPSAASPPATTVGNPDPPVISQVASANHRLTVSATSTNGSGCSTYSIEYAINGGAWQASNVFNGLTNGTRYTVSARTRLPGTCTGGLTFVSSAVTANGTPYGPLVQPSITSSRNGNVITWNWSTNRADDGRPDWSASLGGPCAAVAVSAGSHTQDFGAGPQTQTCTITVSAGGVPSLSASSSQSIPAPPAPTLDAWLSPNGAPISGSYWVHGSGTNWPAGARYYIQCRDAGGAYVDTRNNIPVSYAARYVGGDGQLSWGNSICYTNTAADEVRVWVEGGPDMTVTIG